MYLSLIVFRLMSNKNRLFPYFYGRQIYNLNIGVVKFLDSYFDLPFFIKIPLVIKKTLCYFALLKNEKNDYSKYKLVVAK